MGRHAAILLMSWLVVGPRVARADESAALAPTVAVQSPDALDRAETSFFEGLAHYRGGRFEAAAAAFQRTYVLSAHRDMLFNAARSREQLKDVAAAAAWYRAYLDTKPSDVTAIIHRIRLLGGDPEARPMVPTTRAPTIDSQPVVEEGPGAWPWMALAVGLASVGAGTYLGISAVEDAADGRHAETVDDASSFRDSADGKALAANALFGVGAIGVAAAALLWWRADDGVSTQPRLGVIGGAQGVGLGGSF